MGEVDSASEAIRDLASHDTYDEYITSVLNDIEGPKSDKLKVLTFLFAQLHAEQSHFWSRSAGLAAVNAGLFVVYGQTLDKTWPQAITAWIGIVVAVVWLLIQLRSKHYADRWKRPLHTYRTRNKLLWELEWKEWRKDPAAFGDGHPTTVWRRLASTTIALSLPVVALIAWSILLWLSRS